jgi:hypothetical protein
MQFTDQTPRTEFTCQGIVFTCPQPYVPGPRELTEGEASTLNQTMVENVRNNFAGKLKANAEKPEAERKTFTQADVDAYVTEYEFGVRKAGSGEARLTPVEREARRIARDRITAVLKERNQKVDKDRMEVLVSELAAKPAVVKEAEKRVAAVGKISIEELGLGDEPQEKAA